MELKFSIQTRIDKPVDGVFRAVADENEICKYFTNKTSGPLAEGQTIIWHWSSYGDHPVTVKRLIPNEKIVLEWKANRDDSYNTEVILSFEPIDEKSTLLKISESGWKENQKGLDSSYDNCSGWQHMASALKMYLQHGIDLRN